MKTISASHFFQFLQLYALLCFECTRCKLLAEFYVCHLETLAVEKAFEETQIGEVSFWFRSSCNSYFKFWTWRVEVRLRRRWQWLGVKPCEHVELCYWMGIEEAVKCVDVWTVFLGRVLCAAALAVSTVLC